MALSEYDFSKIIDIRQTPQWGTFLESLKWESHFVENILVMTRSLGIGSAVKIQHPTRVTSQNLIDIEILCKKKNALFIKLEPFLGQDIKLITDAGYVESPYPQCVPSTMYLNLAKSQDELWGGISHSGKYAINRGKREGAEVTFITNPFGTAELKQFYDLCRETGKLRKFYVPPFSELASKAKAFGNDAILGLVHNTQKQLISGKFYVGAGDMVLYVVGGTSSVGRSERGGFNLMWESMLYLKERGYKILDLEGVDDPRYPIFTKNWGGFSHFKEKFGGDIVRFDPPMIKYLSPVFKLLARHRSFRF